MSTIDPRIGLQAALQARVAASRARAHPADAGRPGDAAAAPVASSLAARIQAIPADDPGRRARAVRMFLESELLREFGADLINDPQFAMMVDAVHRQMRDDPAIAEAADALADLLLAPGAP